MKNTILLGLVPTMIALGSRDLPELAVPRSYDSFEQNLDVDENTAHKWTFGLTYFLKGDALKFMLKYLLGYGAPDNPRQGNYSPAYNTCSNGVHHLRIKT